MRALKSFRSGATSHVTSHPATTARLDGALHSEPHPPYAYQLAGERLRVRLRTALDDPRRPIVAWSDRQYWQGPDHEAPLRWYADDERFRHWEGDLSSFEGRVRYLFRLEGATGIETVWLGQDGVTGSLPDAAWPDGYFHWPYLHAERAPDVPAWLRDAICYEIFPERFARGAPPVAPEVGADWPGHPTHRAFWGGDLRGVLDQVGYLETLGVNLLWLTPVFASPSNHKYDTEDYTRIDPHFGDEELFARLVGAARQRGVRILLDGVFNHAGALFAPWRDVVARGAASPYWGWFDVRGERPDPAARNYRIFGHTAAMPRLRTANPEVQAYLIEQAARWMRMGIAGWRLDVADEVDASFWRAFRREMRAIDPQAYLVGEIGYNSARWLEGDQFDGVMSYPWRRALLQYLAPPGKRPPGAPAPSQRLDGRGYLQALGRIRAWYPGWATTAALNALSTHDTSRFLTAMGGDIRRWRLGMLALLTAEGIPQLYYGDEVGMEGGEDPDCRRPMEWEPARQNAETLTTTRALTRLRRERPALRGSGFRPLESGHPSVAAYLRGVSGYEEAGVAGLPAGVVALIALNASEEPCEVTLDLRPSPLPGALNWPDSVRTLDLLSGRAHTVKSHTLRLTLAPLDGAILAPEN